MKKIFKGWTKFQIYLLIFSSIILIMSGIISVVCFILGMILSFFLNMPTGAAIVAVYFVLLAITTISTKIAKI